MSYTAPSSRPLVTRPAAAGSPWLWIVLSPTFVLSAAWLIGFVMYFVAASLRYELSYLRFLAAQVPDLATSYSYIWLVVAFLAMMGGIALANFQNAQTAGTAIKPWSEPHSYRAIVIAFIVVAATAFLWVGITVLQVGLGQMISLAASENVEARDLVLDAQFPGGRMISNGFMGIAVFVASFIALPRKTPLKSDKLTILIAIWGFSLFYLGIMPILISGRINFFAAIIGSYIAACIVQRRLYAVQLIPVGLAAMALVWGAKQYFSMGHVTTESPLAQAVQGALFYFYNDMANSLNIVGNIEGNYSFGWESLRFIFFFTFTDDLMLSLTADHRLHSGVFKDAGEFPLLTAPYVDFGYAGLALLVLFGFIVQWLYNASRRDPRFAAACGLAISGVAMSTHSAYLTGQDLMFNIFLVIILAYVSKGPVFKRA